MKKDENLIVNGIIKVVGGNAVEILASQGTERFGERSQERLKGKGRDKKKKQRRLGGARQRERQRESEIAFRFSFKNKKQMDDYCCFFLKSR